MAAMSSYVDFGAFAGKTGPTISYKNPSADDEFLPVGSTIYWYKVLCTRPTYDFIGSVDI